MPTPQNLSSEEINAHHFAAYHEAIARGECPVKAYKALENAIEWDRRGREREREEALKKKRREEYAKRKEAGTLRKPQKTKPKPKTVGKYYWDVAKRSYRKHTELDATVDAMRKKPTKQRKRRAKRVQWVAETYWDCKAKAHLPKKKGRKYYDEKTKTYVTYLGPLRVEIEPPPKVEEVKEVKVKTVQVAEPPKVKEDTYYDIRYRKHVPKKRGRKYYDEKTKQYVVYTGPKPEIQHYDFSNDIKHTWDGQHYEL